MATEPRIYTKNYVNSDCAFTVSSGANILNACDRDNISQYVSSGANSDSTAVIIVINFYEGSAATSRTFDTILLVNHNLKNYTLEYWNGSAYVNFITQTTDTSQSKPVNVSTYGQTPTALASFSQVVASSKIRITINTTQTANQEKAIGEIVVCNLTLNIGIDLNSYAIQFRQKVKDLMLGDGSMHRAYIHWTPNRIEKYEATVAWTFVPEATRAAMMLVKQSGQGFLWYPESITKPDEIWYCHWYDPRNYQYDNYVKSGGWDVQAMFKEI